MDINANDRLLAEAFAYKGKFVVAKMPSAFGQRFSTPYTIAFECDTMEVAQSLLYSLQLKSLDDQPNKLRMYQVMSRKNFLISRKRHMKLVEKCRQKRLKFIREARLKLANCSAAVYKMRLRNKSDFGIHISSTQF